MLNCLGTLSEPSLKGWQNSAQGKLAPASAALGPPNKEFSPLCPEAIVLQKRHDDEDSDPEHPGQHSRQI